MTLEDERACMAPLQLAGQLIVESGGEIYRVEETITRMGRALGLRDVDSFAVPSGVFISYRLSDGTVETAVRRLHPGATDLERIDRVNSVSRRIEEGTLTLAQASAELEAIRDERKPVRRWQPLAAWICASGFSLLFGGGVAEFLLSGAVAALVELLCEGLNRARAQSMFITLIGGLVSALVPMAAALLWKDLNTAPTIAGALMPLLPGLAMTNAVQDTVRGDMVAGLSHGMSALLTACLAAGGALVAAALFLRLTGGGAV
ncbi:MAG: threonine/serine exporter family protein [Clostridia bacterium]|nr:threonine/serine exporter family protein [Clostridia bacterium]